MKSFKNQLTFIDSINIWTCYLLPQLTYHLYSFIQTNRDLCDSNQIRLCSPSGPKTRFQRGRGTRGLDSVLDRYKCVYRSCQPDEKVAKDKPLSWHERNMSQRLFDPQYESNGQALSERVRLLSQSLVFACWVKEYFYFLFICLKLNRLF